MNTVPRKLLFSIILILLIPTFAQAQTLKKLKIESTEQFIKRITDFVDAKPHTIIESKEWCKGKTNIVAFFETADEITVGLMFVPIDSFSYHQILIDTFSTKGNTAQIDSVFFFNADNDKAKELIVMTSFLQSDGNKSTKIYWNHIFDNINPSKKTRKLKRLPSTSKKIDGEKFKNPSDIKAELIKLFPINSRLCWCCHQQSKD